MSNAKRRHRLRRRFERRFDLQLKREVGYSRDRARQWNRLLDKARALLHLFPPDEQAHWGETLDAARARED